ncbi:MAG: MATE family efflux transporter [Bacteroidales bacterium]|nr:MATE family efflux transporter [Bacteroidales bacterium]
MYSLKTYLPFYKRNLKVALPVMITQAGQVVVQLADNIMVGHVGTAELAGVSFANAIFLIGFITLIGFSQGLTPLVGESFAKGEHKKASHLLRNSLMLNLCTYSAIGLLLMAIGFFMPHMGQDPQVIPFAQPYYFITVASLIPTSLFFTSRFFAEGIGDTRHAMWITVTSNLLNIFLNWVLIFGHFGLPALGVMGAALATLIARIFCAVAFIRVIFHSETFSSYARMALKEKADKQTLISIARLSLPIAFSSMLESTAFSFAAIMVGWMGKVELAAHQIANSLGQLSFMVACGIGAAATIRVSHQFGAGKRVETLMAGKASVHMGIFYMSSCALLFILLRNFLPYIYTSDPEVIAYASRLILVLSLYQISDAVQLTSMASLRGLKDTKRPMMYAAMSYYGIAIPAAYLLGFVFGVGPEGVWYGLLLGLTVAAVLFYTRFCRICRSYLEKQ